MNVVVYGESQATTVSLSDHCQLGISQGHREREGELLKDYLMRESVVNGVRNRSHLATESERSCFRLIASKTSFQIQQVNVDNESSPKLLLDGERR